MSGAIQILDPGVLALIEDLGRAGQGSVGAGRSGALDRAALGLANRVVGNEPGAAALELLGGGARIRFHDSTWFALTGAYGPVALGVHSVAFDTAVLAPAGSELTIGMAEHGLRYYLAMRGGIAVEPTLGSRSRDTLAGIGPEPLRAGDVLPVGRQPDAPIPSVDTLTVSAPPLETVTVRLRPGPRADWFTDDSLERLYGEDWTVTADGNRVGVRLVPTPAADGEASIGWHGVPPLRRAAGYSEQELPSEAMLPGAIQVPPSGLPTVLLADHPVTGGYPVIAVVADASLDSFAQLRPGQRILFRHAR